MGSPQISWVLPTAPTHSPRICCYTPVSRRAVHKELFMWGAMQDLSLGVFPCIVQRVAAQSARSEWNTKLFLIWWGNFSVEVQARDFGESLKIASLSSNNSPFTIVLEHMALWENENHHFNSIYFYWVKFFCMFSVMTLGNVSKCCVGANSVNPTSQLTWKYKDIIDLFWGKKFKVNLEP